MSFPFDPSAMLGGLQQQMGALKAQAAAEEVEGQAGGGLVRVVANGGLEIVSVSIDPSAAEDTEMLEDLVVAATNDAIRRAQQILTQKMSGMLGGLPLPPGLFG